jgi:hypothetical protein
MPTGLIIMKVGPEQALRLVNDGGSFLCLTSGQTYARESSNAVLHVREVFRPPEGMAGVFS